MPDVPGGNVGTLANLERAAILCKTQGLCCIPGDTCQAFLGRDVKQGTRQVHHGPQ